MSIDAKDPFKRQIEAIIKRPKDKYKRTFAKKYFKRKFDQRS